jgi:hypothetical protein
MIHYHGTPMTPRDELWGMAGKSFCVSYADPRDAEVCLRIGQSVMWDNGAFSLHTKGKEVDWNKYYAWVESRLGHPHWAVVPDIIVGNAKDNLELAKQWPHRKDCAAPVWHLHEPVDQIFKLLDLGFSKLAFGSSGDYWQIGSEKWERRINEAFNAMIHVLGSIPHIHMMRGLGLGGKHWPFASADSTNVTLHHDEQGVTAEFMARQIDAVQCPIRWTPRPVQQDLAT